MLTGPSGQTPSQKAVRVGHFEKTLNRFNVEMSQKIVAALSEYHVRYIGSGPGIDLDDRLKVLERASLIQWAALVTLFVIDWRIGLCAMLLFWRVIKAQIGRGLMVAWIRFYVLITWETSDDAIREGWEPKWYQGLARRLDTDDGFIYQLKPFSWVTRGYDGWLRVRAARRAGPVIVDG